MKSAPGDQTSDQPIDVPRAAAERVGFVRAGLTEVKVEVVGAATPRAGGKKQ